MRCTIQRAPFIERLPACRFLWYLIYFLLTGQLLAQGSWFIYSPLANGEVRDGELVVSLRWEGAHDLDPARTFLVLDKTNLSEQIRVQGKIISLYYSEPIGEGRHQLTLLARDMAGTRLPPVQWSFTVKGRAARSTGQTTAAEAVSREWYWQLNSSLDSRFESLSGPGGALRQEPPRTLYWRLDGEAGVGKWRFPVRLWLTSDETRSAQSRNRYRVGIVGPFVEAYLGDTNPAFHELMLNGNRVRGIQADLHVAGIHFKIAHGDIQRAIPGQIIRLQPGSGILPPPNLNPDSTFAIGGSYRRRLSAAQLSFGSRKTALLAFTALKARDDTSSARTGQTPMDNLVVGGELSLRIPGQKNQLFWQSAAALSLSTRDISSGAATKAEIDSIYGVDFPFDPQDYASLIILNATTYPVEIQRGTSLAYFTRLNWQIGSHTLRGEYRFVGPAYLSLGNPYLRNDRRGYELSDRFSLFQRKMRVQFSWGQFRDNQANNQLSTRRINLLSGRFQIKPSPKAPQILLGLRVQRRESLTSEPRDTDEILWHWMGGIFYQTRIGGWPHQLQVTYNLNDRQDKIRTSSSTRTHHLLFNLNQMPSPAWQTRFNVQWIRVLRPDGDQLYQQQSFGVGVDYRWPSRKGALGIHTQYARTPASAFLPRSSRMQVEVQGRWQPLPGLQFQLGAGYNAYRETAFSENRYDELYVILRQNYALFR